MDFPSWSRRKPRKAASVQLLHVIESLTHRKQSHRHVYGLVKSCALKRTSSFIHVRASLSTSPPTPSSLSPTSSLRYFLFFDSIPSPRNSAQMTLCATVSGRIERADITATRRLRRHDSWTDARVRLPEEQHERRTIREHVHSPSIEPNCGFIMSWMSLVLVSIFRVGTSLTWDANKTKGTRPNTRALKCNSKVYYFPFHLSIWKIMKNNIYTNFTSQFPCVFITNNGKKYFVKINQFKV